MRGIFSQGRDHLDEVGLGYVGHLARALRFSGRLLGAGLARLIHGLIPGLFTHAASRAVKGLHDELTEIPAAQAAHALTHAEAEARGGEHGLLCR